MKTLFYMLLFLSPILGHAQETRSNNKDNGGDICENRIQAIRDDIQSWITRGGSKGLIFRDGVTTEIYNGKMSDAMGSTSFACSSDRIFIGKSEKTCRNYKDN